MGSPQSQLFQEIYPISYQRQFLYSMGSPQPQLFSHYLVSLLTQLYLPQQVITFNPYSMIHFSSVDYLSSLPLVTLTLNSQPPPPIILVRVAPT